jgi:hypothetical protein
MLLDGARADGQLRGDLFVAATQNQQLQNLAVARRNLDFTKAIHHFAILLPPAFSSQQSLRQSFALSTPRRERKIPRVPARKKPRNRHEYMRGRRFGDFEDSKRE